jgi:hypothetical protein
VLDKVPGSETVDLSVRANCELVKRDVGHLEFRFPKENGFLTPARWEFTDRGELVEYLAQLLALDTVGNGLRARGRCLGKYERRDPGGDRAFTFGDPILDLLTDPGGGLVIRGVRVDLARVELGSASHRSGGLSCIDLGLFSEALRHVQTALAAIGEGDSALIECNEEVVSFASSNPSRQDFYREGDHLRFRAWKKNYAFYWSMGAEIETWGHDFDSAEIESRYLDTIAGAVCTAVRIDSDHDTDDDYVDEYEWGISAPQPLRVVSNCSADWHRETFRGSVSAGPECFEI